MTKNFLFILCLNLSLWSSFGWAEETYLSARKMESSGAYQNEAKLLWNKLIACGAKKKEDVLISCLKESLSQESFRAFSGKVYEFLSRGFEVTGVYDCSITEKTKLIEPEKKNVLCFRLLGNKTESTGYVYFKREGSLLKIDKIEY